MSELVITKDNSPHAHEDWKGVTLAKLESPILTDGVREDLDYANKVLKIEVKAMSPEAYDVMNLKFSGAVTSRKRT